MTIAIAIAVPDGIALAADTQTTWQQTITKAKEKASGNEFELEQPIIQPVGSCRAPRWRLTTRRQINTIGDKSNESQDASLRVEMGNPDYYWGGFL